jgi:hypothetical protein
MSDDDFVSMVGVVTAGRPDSIDDAKRIREQFTREMTSREELDRAEQALRDCGLGEEFESLPEADNMQRPIDRQRRRVMMTATRNQDKAKGCPSWEEFAARENAKTRQAERAKLFEGFRSIQIRGKESGGSVVTAVWSDDTFDINKAMSESESNGQPLFSSSDVSVPVCPSCSHQTTFAGQDSGTFYETNVFRTANTPPSVMQYYDSELRGSGWRRTEATTLLNQVLRRTEAGRQHGYRLTAFERGNRRLVVGAFESSGASAKTRVLTMSEGK